ncbi:MAG: ABC transporter permease [Gammaproteobacteria bacterium]|nr:ABC transporter permease [Gammaproteobacteria bacterium]
MLLAIIQKELRLLSRDIHALVVLFLMPIAFILIMSLALQDTMSDAEEDHPKIGMWIDSPEMQAKGIVETLSSPDGFRVVRFETKAAMLESLRADDLTSAVSLPAGFARALKAPHPAPEDRMVLIYSSTAPLVLRRLILASLSKSLAAYQMDRLFSSGIIASPNQAAQKQKFLGQSLITVRDQSRSVAQGHPSSVQQSVPAWLIFSMFFVVIPISTTLLTEKQQGTLQRLSTFPIPQGYLLLGKLIPYLGINLGQTLLMILVGVYGVPLLGGVGLELQGELWLLLPLTISISLAAISLALLIATRVRSVEQATTIGGISNLILAAIGGIMVPTHVMPEFMQATAGLSPMNWGLEGFFSILLRNGDLGMVAPELFKLLSMAGGLFLLTVFFYEKSMDKK